MTLFLTTVTAAPTSLHYSLGIKGGMNLFTFYGRDAMVEAGRTGWRKDAGASLFFCISNKTPFSVQLELSYIKKGFRYYLEYTSEYYASDKFLTAYNTWDELYKLDYVELPLFLKFRAIKFRRASVLVYAGPAVALLLSAKENILDNGTPVCFDAESSTSPFDFSIAAGLAYEVPLWHGRALLDLRYCRSFLTTHRPDNLDHIAHPEAQPLDRKNVGVICMVGYSHDF